MKTVACFGGFDGLHQGHEAYLDEARSLGDRVCILLESDRSVLTGSGQLPGNSEGLRQDRLAALNIAQDIRICEREDLKELVSEFKPDIIFLPFYETALARRLKEMFEEDGPEITLSRPFAIGVAEERVSTAFDGHDSLPI